MEMKLKSWQGWLLFGGSMVVVFVLGLCVSALMERRAELESVFNNRRTVITGIEARNEVFKSDFPREYQTWTETAKTDFQSEFNGNIAVDVLEQRPEMVVRQVFVRVHLLLPKMARNRLPAGHVRVRMFPV